MLCSEHHGRSLTKQERDDLRRKLQGGRGNNAFNVHLVGISSILALCVNHSGSQQKP